MKTVQLSGSPRANVGKKATKAVRNEGRVPCVLYGAGEQIYFSVRSVDLEKLIFNPSVYIIELDVDGVKKNAIIQDKQMDPLTDKPLHVDFLELSDNKPVKIKIPIKLEGRARGVVAGGNLITNFRKITVLGLPKDLPDFVQLDISPLRIGHSIRVSEVNIPGIKVLDAPNAVIVAVKMSRGAVDDSDDEEEDSESGEGGETAEAATEAEAADE